MVSAAWFADEDGDGWLVLAEVEDICSRLDEIEGGDSLELPFRGLVVELEGIPTDGATTDHDDTGGWGGSHYYYDHEVTAFGPWDVRDYGCWGYIYGTETWGTADLEIDGFRLEGGIDFTISGGWGLWDSLDGDIDACQCGALEDFERPHSWDDWRRAYDDCGDEGGEETGGEETGGEAGGDGWGGGEEGGADDCCSDADA